MNATEGDDLSWLSNRFCKLPWTMAEIHADGNVYVCCPRYSGEKHIGNIYHGTALEIWNSKEAQQFREGILSGKFSMCHFNQCPLIAGRHLPEKLSIEDDTLRNIIDNNILIDNLGPRHVKLAHDDSCNLSCPSCRDEIIIAKKSRQQRLDGVLNDFILPFLKNCEYLELSGDGDPFASKHYRDIIKYSKILYPKMRISLHTNGVLCDEDNFNKLDLGGRLSSVLVSIDAASSETYSIVRRGGNWSRLQENLVFLKRMRAEGKISKLTIAFVVQKANFFEMADFVRLGKSLSVDEVEFSLIYNWNRANWGTQFSAQQIWNTNHSQFYEFKDVIADSIFNDQIVKLGDVVRFRSGGI